MPEEKPKTEEDVVWLHGPTDDGEGVRVIRSRTGRPLEAGEVRGAKEGKPLMGAELVTLTPRAGAPRLCDVSIVAGGKVEPEAQGQAQAPAPAPVPAPAHAEAQETKARAVEHGPAQVATDAYRTSWERIFGGGRASGKKGAAN
jgi:hypothetical protein